MAHTVCWLQKFQNYKPDIILHLRPTYPNRSSKLIDECLTKFIQKRNKYDSLRSVSPCKKSPYKMYFIKNTQNILQNVIPNNGNDLCNQSTQSLPKTYIHNGCIDILNTDILFTQKSVSGKNILPFIMNECHDIDTMEDWQKSECLNNQMNG